MTAPPRYPPELPLEILEQIIEHHGIGEAEQWDEPDEQTSRRYHSKALLACHMVSRQFRACALRIICRKTVIDLQDKPERLRRLQEVLVAKTHSMSQLDSPLQFIKELVIILTNFKFCRWERPMYGFDKEAVVSLLKIIEDNVPLEKLSIFGNTLGGIKAFWSSLESDILNGLKGIIQLPSVVSLYLRDVRHLPYQLPTMATSLHTLHIFRSDYSQYDTETGVVPPFTATFSKLENLSIEFCSQFPEVLQLPTLRKISAVHRYPEDAEASWSCIQRSSQTLVHLRVDDGEGEDENLPAFLKTLNLSSFPQLETFTYIFSSTHYRKMFPTLVDLASFLTVHYHMPNFRVIKLHLRLQGRKAFREEYLSAVRNHPGWAALDKTFASGHLSEIESASIDLVISFSDEITQLWDGTVRVQEVKNALSAGILVSFNQSRKCSIPIQVDVHLDKC